MKKIIAIVLMFLLILCGTYTFLRLYKFRVNSEAVQLHNVTLTSEDTSFEIIQTHSGYHIKEYRYKIDDNVMYIEFYGTMFGKFGLDDANVIIPEGNVKEVIVLDNIK